MITKPTLILDEKRCRKNIETMFKKASRNNLDFRPHFKTHQSIEVGNWFKEFGVNKIAVSSLEMAEYFSNDWDDITVAFPINILEIDTINKLANKINLSVLIESVETIEFLNNNLTNKINFFVKIDVGYNRTGLLPTETEKIDNILTKAKNVELLEFIGFLSHAGHTYKCRSKQEILNVHNKSVSILENLRKNYETQYPDLIISYGDTPSCSVAENFPAIDELRPGNFVFYDLSQYQIGACELDQIAVAMACPIVAIHKDRNEIVTYGGGVHLSKERMSEDEFGTIYGLVVEKQDNSWGKPIPKTFVKSLSQEHGIISVPKDDSSNYKVGEYLTILPVHSCMSANLMDFYITDSGKKINRI